MKDGTVSPEGRMPSRTEKTSVEKGSDYYKKTINWYFDARKIYDNTEDSPEVRRVNEEFLELGFRRLSELQDPKNLDEARSSVEDYADILCILGFQSLVKDNITENNPPEMVEDIDIKSGRSEELFMTTCEKLFPDIKTQVNTKDLKGNLEKVALMLEHNELVGNVRAHAELYAKEIDQLSSSQSRDLFESSLMDDLGSMMARLITQPKPEEPGLRAVPENNRKDAINATQALYILKLSTPKQAMSPAEFVIAKAKLAHLTTK